MVRRAAIDLGSNSVLLTVVEADGSVVHDEARVVGLGQGLGERGLLRPERMEAAVEALADFARVARELGVAPGAVRGVTTSAARRALNAATFLARVRAVTGITLEVISGDEEARLSWLGARQGLALEEGPVGLVDVGGGSTELVVGAEGRVSWRVSVEAGSVRLTEAFLGTGVVNHTDYARLRGHVDGLFGPVRPQGRCRVALAVAGSATTLAAMDLGLGAYDGARVHGYRLTRAAIRTWIDRLLGASPEERRALVAVSPERADSLLAGATLLDAGLAALGRQAAVVSDRGLRFGVLAEGG